MFSITEKTTDLCCRPAEVDRGTRPRHCSQPLTATWNPETCFPDDLNPGTLAQTETEASSGEESSRELPGEVEHLAVQAAGDTTQVEMKASVWTAHKYTHDT